MTALYKHHRGGLYAHLMTVRAAGDIKEGDSVILYVSLQDGDVWARSHKQFSEALSEEPGDPKGSLRFKKLYPVEAEDEVKKRNKKLGIKPRKKKKKKS